MSLRGVQVLTAMTLVAEVGDFSRFKGTAFAHALFRAHAQ